MAKMLDAFINSYNFVDSAADRMRQRERQKTLQERQDILWQQAQKDRETKLKQQEAFRKDFSQYYLSLLPEQVKTPQVVSKAEMTINDVMNNPEKVIDNISTFYNDVAPALDAGKLPDPKAALKVINTTLYPELQQRLSRNGLKGHITGLYPTPDGTGLYMEAKVKAPTGQTYTVPLTEGAGAITDPNAAKHPVQAFPVRKVISHVAQGVQTQKDILAHMIRYGGAAGVKFVEDRIKENFQRELEKEKQRGTLTKEKLETLQKTMAKALDILGRIKSAEITRAGREHAAQITADATKYKADKTFEGIKYKQNNKENETTSKSLWYVGTMAEVPIKEGFKAKPSIRNKLDNQALREAAQKINTTMPSEFGGSSAKRKKAFQEEYNKAKARIYAQEFGFTKKTDKFGNVYYVYYAPGADGKKVAKDIRDIYGNPVKVSVGAGTEANAGAGGDF